MVFAREVFLGAVIDLALSVRDSLVNIEQRLMAELNENVEQKNWTLTQFIPLFGNY